MSKKKTPLQIRKESKEFETARLTAALKKAKLVERRTEIKGKKRKDESFLQKYVSVSVSSPSGIRPPAAFSSRSYNLSKQVLDLVDHVFVRYKTPAFLYRCMLTPAGRALVFDEKPSNAESPFKAISLPIERRVFLAAAQGRSVANELKVLLNKREAHWFLQAPEENEFGQNLFWAKCAAAGANRATAQFLTERLADGAFISNVGERLDDVIRFFVVEAPKLTENTRLELVDFVRAMAAEPRFLFKGRTLSSMAQLCDEWHRTQFTGTIKKYESWPAEFDHWEHRTKFETVRVVELSNNRAMAEEGRTQKHCVFTYTQWCMKGWTRIVSFRWVEFGAAGETKIVKRLTAEVSVKRRAVVQVRGSLNRTPTPEEMKVVRYWSRSHGLLVEVYEW